MKKICLGVLMCLLMACFVQNSFGAILIAEVSNDPSWSGDPEGEYLIICNTGAGSVNIKDYSFNDNSVSPITISTVDLFIVPLGCLVIMSDGAADPTNPITDSTRYNCGSALPSQSTTLGSWTNNFANTGDFIELRDNTGAVIDAMSYGTNTSIMNPSVTDTNPGQVMRRIGFPNNRNFTDTNTNADWQTVYPDGSASGPTVYGSSVSPCGITNAAPTAGDGIVSGRVTNEFNRAISRAFVSALDTNTGESFGSYTNSFGYYNIEGLEVGHFYIMQASHKRYIFSNSQSFSLNGNLDNVNFTADSSLIFRPIKRF